MFRGAQEASRRWDWPLAVPAWPGHLMPWAPALSLSFEPWAVLSFSGQLEVLGK